MCANNDAGANIYLPSRFAAPLPPLRPGDEVLIWVLPLAGSPALPEIRTDDDVLALIVPNCTAPTITTQPQPASICPTGAAAFSVAADGTGPFTYQWQWRPTGGQFANMIDGVNTDPQGGPIRFIAKGARTGTVSIENTGGTGTANSHWEKRCIVTNVCGNATSDAASFTICAADFNCSGFIDDTDFVTFAAAYEAFTVPPADASADLTGDGFVDDADFVIFAAAYEGFVCP
jgi:hypothetical protein